MLKSAAAAAEEIFLGLSLCMQYDMGIHASSGEKWISNDLFFYMKIESRKDKKNKYVAMNYDPSI